MNNYNNHEYVSSFEFEVSFQGIKIGFSKVTNMEAKIEYETIYEGGNDIPILLPLPNRKPNTITFEKGLLLNKSKTIWDKLKPGMMVYAVVIDVMKNKQVVRKLTFQQGMVLKKKYPLLDATFNGVYIETLEIAHSGLEEEYV